MSNDTRPASDFPPRDRTASTCANFTPYPPSFSRSRGTCQRCGVPWQDFEVGCYFRCQQWTPREGAHD